MKREAQTALSVEAQHALGYYVDALHQMEDLSAVTIRNYLSDLREFMDWYECCWRDEWTQVSFTLQAVTPPLLFRYWTYLQATLWLKPPSINRAVMSLKRYFACATKVHVIQQYPTSTVKFVPKEVVTLRHLNSDEESALVAVVNATGTLPNRTIIILLLQTELRAREQCTLIHKQVHLGKRHGTLRVLGKRNKFRDIPLNATARSILSVYLETLPKDGTYLFHSEKTQEAHTERVCGHLIAKYARLAHLVDVSPHGLRHRSGYRMAEVVPLHRLAQIMCYDSLDTTMLYVRGTKHGLQHEMEKIAWT